MSAGVGQKKMRIRLNGEVQEIETAASVASIIAMRRPRPPFAVEVNKRLIRRQAYEATVLCEGDVVEIVTLVGGG